MKKKEISREIIERLLTIEKIDDFVIDKISKEVAQKHKVNRIPTKVEILGFCEKNEKEKLEKYLKTKPSRSISGVSVITVVAKPRKCPGKCIYCPKGSKAPKSYTGFEPAIQRGIRNNYDPFLQVRDRLKQYEATGHPRDKIEIIILGGTFLSLDKDYQEWFVKRIFDSLNGKESESLASSQRINENAKHRCVGLTIETRPDFCFEEHINQMLNLGVTRVEIGVQTIYPEVLEKISRGHDLESTIKATQLSKDSGLKVTYHIMPGLFVDFKRDLEQFKRIFSDERFRPDSLKIYPTLVIPGTPLYKLWRKGLYKPLENEEGVKLISEAMKYIPKYCRVIRVQRDIPSDKIAAGIKKSNLRELVERECEKRGIRIKEIRYREVGHKILRGGFRQGKIEICRTDYRASGGKEIFLSFEDLENDIIFGFLRLRIPDKPFRQEINKETALVRELHVYGSSLKIGEKMEDSWQHRGLGKRLLEEAERISKDEFGKNKICVISGIGVRNYYSKFGYFKEGVYMSKKLG
ncbi:MAG: tRNA uridine(34) 5-carboxymethylaminomethyl modification radical SAM/GNAT enzyme Elp3 [Candidatus Aenigmatarchaeota archaeon]